MTDKSRTTAKPMLDWQYRTLLSELSQVTLHASDDSCPCNQVHLGDDGKYNPEYCLGKHLLNVNSLAIETALMDSMHSDMLMDMASEALEFHEKAKSIYCKGGTWPDLAQWSRNARKKLEPVYYSCKVSLRQEAPQCKLEQKIPYLPQSWSMYYDNPQLLIDDLIPIIGKKTSLSLGVRGIHRQEINKRYLRASYNVDGYTGKRLGYLSGTSVYLISGDWGTDSPETIIHYIRSNTKKIGTAGDSLFPIAVVEGTIDTGEVTADIGESVFLNAHVVAYINRQQKQEGQATMIGHPGPGGTWIEHLTVIPPTCTVLKTHDDGDLTLKCKTGTFVVTTEGQTFKETQARLLATKTDQTISVTGKCGSSLASCTFTLRRKGSPHKVVKEVMETPSTVCKATNVKELVSQSKNLLGGGTCTLRQEHTSVSIPKLAKKIERASTDSQKNALFLSVYGEDRMSLMQHIILSMPKGTYLLKREGFASPSLEREIINKYGIYAGTNDLEKIVRGLSTTHPERVSANLTLGLDELTLKPAPKVPSTCHVLKTHDDKETQAKLLTPETTAQPVGIHQPGHSAGGNKVSPTRMDKGIERAGTQDMEFPVFARQDFESLPHPAVNTYKSGDKVFGWTGDDKAVFIGRVADEAHNTQIKFGEITCEGYLKNVGEASFVKTARMITPAFPISSKEAAMKCSLPVCLLQAIQGDMLMKQNKPSISTICKGTPATCVFRIKVREPAKIVFDETVGKSELESAVERALGHIPIKASEIALAPETAAQPTGIPTVEVLPPPPANPKPLPPIAEVADKAREDYDTYIKMLRYEPSTLGYHIENEALMQVPIYESHSRGKNWLAKITSDPQSPGGLQREFQERAHGNYYYMVTDLHPGDAIEFGADYYSGGGSKNPKRWYGIVAAKTPTTLWITQTMDARAAIKLAKDVAPLIDFAEMRQNNAHLADPLLAAIARELCTVGVCLASESKPLPTCTPARADKLERCILKVKARNTTHGCTEAGDGSKSCPSAFAVCQSSLKCKKEG